MRRLQCEAARAGQRSGRSRRFDACHDTPSQISERKFYFGEGDAAGISAGRRWQARAGFFATGYQRAHSHPVGVRSAPALLVAFICNHCPFVLHIIDEFAAFARDYAPKGLQVVAISSNDTAEFPEDGFEHTGPFASAHDFTFPYLYDGDQQVALAYNAICTPDFFLYGPDRTLAYAGQFDASRPKINRPPVPGLAPLRTDLPVTGEDMRAAVDAVLAGRAVPEPQRPSAGCSIKWKEGRNPSWA